MGKYSDLLEDSESAAEPGPAPVVPARSIPPRDQAGLQRRIAAGTTPQKTALDMALESIGESNRAVGSAMLDRTLMGVPARLDEAVEGLPPGTHARIAAENPFESSMAGLPAAAIDTAAMSGQATAIGEALSPLVRNARPALQTAARAMTGGAAFGGADAALRGGDVGNVVEGAGQGAAGNLAFSALPAAAGKIASSAEDAIMSRAAKPLLAVGQGKAANRTQLALGAGDKELGKSELKRVIADEGLEPVIRKDPASLGNVVRAKQDAVWEQELGPIREMAWAAEPGAKVPVAKIRDRLKAILGDEAKGTNAHDDVDKAISLLEDRAAKIGTKGQFPVRNLLRNAQEFERDGYGGTEAKFADKQTARAIGKTLRTLVDERLSSIYQRHPELAARALGRTPDPPQPRLLDTGAPNPDYVPRRAFGTPPLDLESVGDRYRRALEHFADLKGIEPAAEQYASRMGQERPGLINSVKRAGGRLLGAVAGGHIAGAPGALIGGGIPEAASAAVGPAQRMALRLSRPFAGPMADPGASGAAVARLTIPELRAIAERVLNRRQEGE